MMDWPLKLHTLIPTSKFGESSKEVGKFSLDNKYTFAWGVEDMEETLYIRKYTLYRYVYRRRRST